MDGIIEHFRESRCDYCHSELDKSKCNSEWKDKFHYKSVACPGCGKKCWIKVDFEGSGHDCIFDKNESPLESTIRKVRGDK